MRIAFCKCEKAHLKKAKLLLGLDPSIYDIIVIYPKEERVSWKEIVNQVKITGEGEIIKRTQTKYAAFFNGNPYILDTQDILFFESYYRKTSVVVNKGRIRIRAKIDEEEKKLPKNQFVRINRHNIINMRYIRSVHGEVLEMNNGEILYVNDSRKKNFEQIYVDFLKDNGLLL